MSQVTPDQARTSAQALRKFWQAGQVSKRRLIRLRGRDPASLDHGNKQATLQEEAQHLGLNINLAAKARRVAEEYTEADIEKLCAAVARHRAPFSSTHLVRLLAVHDRKERQRLIQAAIRNGWTVSQVESAAQCSQGRRHFVGRKPLIPEDEGEVLVALEGQCLRWVRSIAVADERLPVDLREPIDQATRAVRRVQKVVAAALTTRLA